MSETHVVFRCLFISFWTLWEGIWVTFGRRWAPWGALGIHFGAAMVPKSSKKCEKERPGIHLGAHSGQKGAPGRPPPPQGTHLFPKWGQNHLKHTHADPRFAVEHCCRPCSGPLKQLSTKIAVVAPSQWVTETGVKKLR